MKSKKTLISSIVVSYLIITGTVFAIHNLYPDNGKTTSQSTFHSLNDLFNLVADSANPIIKNTPDSPISTTTEPTATTTHSISEIYAIIANMVRPENIRIGNTILGVPGTSGSSTDYSTTTTESVASLTPSVSVDTKTDYSLDDVWNLIQVSGSAASTPRAHNFPVSSEPDPTMHTTSEIYDYIVDTLISYLEDGNNIINFQGTILGVAGTFNPVAEAEAAAEATIVNGLRTGLVGYWPFNETSGTVAVDYSGNGNNGALVGDTLNNQIGMVGGAYSLDGVEDYVEVPNSSSLQITGDITISAWVKRNADDYSEGPYPGYSAILSKNEVEGLYDYDFYFVSDPATSLELYSDSTDVVSVDSGPTFSDESWHHVLVVRAGNSVSFYVDGVFKTTVSMIGDFGVSASRVTIGTEWVGFTDLHGLLDEVAIWNRALSDAEVSQLYNNNLGRTLIINP